MPPSSQAAYQSLQDYTKNRKSSQQIQQEADQKYDVGGISSRLSSMRTLVGNLENSIENVDPSVRGRSAGGFVTEGQNQALINRERTPLLGSLSKQQSAMGDTQQQFSLASTLAGQLAQNMRSDDETGYQRMLDQYNAALAQEQAAEAKRQYEENLKLEREKQAAAQRAAQASSGYNLASLLGGGGGSGGAGGDVARPPLESIIGAPQSQSQPGSTGSVINAPKAGYSLAGALLGPYATVGSLAAGTYAANKDKANYVLNNKAKLAKQAGNKVGGFFKSLF